MIPLSAALLMAVWPAQAAPDLYCGAENVIAADGAIQLARRWESAFTDDFNEGLGRWRITNYEGKLAFESADGDDGGRAALVTNHGAAGDTAFELTSELIPVIGGEHFRLGLRWRSNRAMKNLTGHKGLYMTQLQWLDDAAEAIGAAPFVFGEAGDEWQTLHLEGAVPANTGGLVIRIGCDNPNIADGEFLALDDIQLELQSATGGYEQSGNMQSRPMHAPDGDGRIGWQADVPPGTSVRFQVASAPEAGGGPGEWSEFSGPDGSAGTFFEQPGALSTIHRGRPWLRYAASIRSDDRARTPVLKQVTVGGESDGPWSGPDTQPPIITERSPTRTADAGQPISFQIRDETGIDPLTLQVWLDGSDITDALALHEGTYTYTPPAPLAPPPAGLGMARWRTTNYAGALTVSTVARTDASPAGVHVTRAGGDVDTAFRLESPPIPVEGGAAYRLSYWSRHSVDLRGAMSGTTSFSGGLQWLNVDGAPIGERAPIDFGPANLEWHRDESALTAPDGAHHATISFGFDTPNLFDGAFVDIAEADLDGPHPDRGGDEPNLHRVALHAGDFAGNALRREWYLLIRPPRTENVVTLRDDGMTLIDGEPFFPIGLYAVWKKDFNENSFDKAFSDLRAAGFNTAHTYSSARGPEFEEFYAAAERHGIKLYIASGSGANTTGLDTVLWDVVREEGRAPVLAWYLADDTASHVGHDDLRRLSDAIHDVDPAHITVQADGVGAPPNSRYASYVDSTDGFLPELYPIHDDTDRGVPRIISDMQTVRADLDAAGAPPKTVWAIVQYFQGWGWPRYPTRDELWAMSYLSIIHGAHGITWYTYGGWGENHGVTDFPEQWGNICGLARELSSLQDVLTERTGPQPAMPQILAGPETDALGHPSISILLKDHAGKRTLIAANSARAEVTARIGAGGGATLTLPFEDREISADADGFQDTFGPYAVHVYVW